MKTYPITHERNCQEGLHQKNAVSLLHSVSAFQRKIYRQSHGTKQTIHPSLSRYSMPVGKNIRCPLVRTYAQTGFDSSTETHRGL